MLNVEMLTVSNSISRKAQFCEERLFRNEPLSNEGLPTLYIAYGLQVVLNRKNV
jgi:hypothetical protein